MTENKTYWGSCPPASVTPSGDKLRPVFNWNKEGTALVKTGEVDIQADIDAAAVGITPYEIIDRMTKTGDSTPLEASKGVYGDASNIPDNISDINRLSLDAKSQLDAIEAAEKAKASAPVSPVKEETKPSEVK